MVLGLGQSCFLSPFGHRLHSQPHLALQSGESRCPGTLTTLKHREGMHIASHTELEEASVKIRGCTSSSFHQQVLAQSTDAAPFLRD